MKRWCVPAFLAALVFAACGDDATTPPGDGSGTGSGEGTGTETDGGVDVEAGAQTDDTDGRPCGRAQSGGSVDGNGCTSTQSYSCGSSAYEIACSCPAATCTCTKNGAVVGTATWTGCSGGGGCAISFTGVAEQCGIPSGGGGPSVPPPPDDE